MLSSVIMNSLTKVKLKSLLIKSQPKRKIKKKLNLWSNKNKAINVKNKDNNPVLWTLNCQANSMSVSSLPKTKVLSSLLEIKSVVDPNPPVIPYNLINKTCIIV